MISISPDISRWENTSADIELRAGDTLNIPKRPSFVAVSRQVYNPIAISYSPGKKLGWYLRKGGGAMRSGNKRDIYVLRSDGSVVPRGRGWFSSNFNDLRMRPGDTIFVPEDCGRLRNLADIVELGTSGNCNRDSPGGIRSSVSGRECL